MISGQKFFLIALNFASTLAEETYLVLKFDINVPSLMLAVLKGWNISNPGKALNTIPPWRWLKDISKEDKILLKREIISDCGCDQACRGRLWLPSPW